VQRALRLATVHVDVAGKRAGAKFRDRGVDGADALVEHLAARSRGARRRVAVEIAASVPALLTGRPFTGIDVPSPPASAPASSPASAAPPGWFADPARRHQARYWNGTGWTEHVVDEGSPGIDPL
jgi:hypothetical protein